MTSDAQTGIADGLPDESVPAATGDGSSSESITLRAYARLRADIISGELEPGRKLKIEELRRRYDVGSSPIREALSLLTSDHFVERMDQRGFRVAPVSAGEFEELLRTRCWLEERALRESIAHGETAWEEQVVLAAYRLTRVPRTAGDDAFVANTEWETRHKHFHMTLISACRSGLLVRFCDRLYDQNIRYRQLSGPVAYPGRDVNAEHGAICDAVLARDADRASELLVAHYTRTGDFVTQRLAD